MEEIIIWLKSSLAGIIILGSIGSLLAASVIYIFTKIIPKTLGYGNVYLFCHKQVFDRVFAKRQYNYIITYFTYHLMHVLLSVIGGMGFASIAMVVMYEEGEINFSWRGVYSLSAGFLLLAWGAYHAYFIDRAYQSKLIPLLNEANGEDSDKTTTHS